MHELSLVENLITQIRQHAEGRPVKNITVTVGVMTCVDPDAMAFCFAACRTDAGLSDTELIIERQLAAGYCQDCGATFTVEQLIQPWECGSLRVAIDGGIDILLKELEFA